MNFFEILRDHARRIPDDVATSSSRHRLTTYRKLWSRVERACARLQGEWMVEAGDKVMYVGHAHPDALILWIALARMGAMLMPVEHAALHDQVAVLADRHGVRLLLHDDGLSPPLAGDFCSCLALSSLIARPCTHQATGFPESVVDVSLILLAAPSCTTASALHASAYSLHDLSGHAGQPVAWPATQVLFDAQRLRRQILPALKKGLPLQFD